MADVIVSVVVERLAATLEEQIRYQVNFVSGVENEIVKLSDELKTVRNVLDDAEKKGYKDKRVKDWLTRLEDTSYELDDVLDEWNIAILEHSKYKVPSYILSLYLYFKKVVVHRDIALKFEEVKAQLDLVLVDKDQYGFATSQPIDPSRESRVQSTSYIESEEVYGRDLEREDLVRKLVGEGGIEEDQLGIHVVSIVGAGGLGKTTLAKLAYNDSRVKKCFGLKIWIRVSNPFDEVVIGNGIIEGARGRKPYPNNLETVLQRLKETISGKKFLLVLDNVWTEDVTKWEPLKICLGCGGAGSKILVTTRNERVATIIGAFKNGIHHLRHLSNEECWLLLGRISLFAKDEKECEKFESIGKRIANKCKGSPLAAKTLGSLFRSKNTLEEWESVLNSEIWELEEVEVHLFPFLLLSYNELSPPLKRCFSYCAVFPKDTGIDVEKLITEWMALGYLGSNAGDWEVRGRGYFDKLAMLSLFQDFDRGYSNEQIKSFKMHDILHDFAQLLRKNVGSRMEKTTCQACSSLLVSHVQEYRSLFHCKDLLYDVDPHFCDGLTSLRVLNLRDCRLRGIPKEIEKLIHLRWLDLGCNKFSNRDDLKGICVLYNLQFLWLDNCKLEEIPSEIGNLIHMIQLDLSYNELIELPESLCNMLELESLNVYYCTSLFRLPQGMHMLVNLKHLHNDYTYSLEQYPLRLAKLTSLVTLTQFHGSKLGWLKNLNRLSGEVKLRIKLSSGDDLAVEDAREAELGKKMHIQKLVIDFCGSKTMGGGEAVKESVWIDVIDALEPYQNLQNLNIWYYDGTRFPGWIVSPLNQVRSITLVSFGSLSSLPPLGKLPLLETLEISRFFGLEFVGREFLGITTTTAAATRSGDHIVWFPKLKKLRFRDCSKWKEWEDITAEEEEDSVDVSIMPCLTKLEIMGCSGLTELPLRLLKKASSSLKLLNIYGSKQLIQVYGDEDGQAWKSVSHHNPHLHLRNDIPES